MKQSTAFLLAAMIGLAGSGGQAFAQSGAAGAPKVAVHPAIEPAALDLVKAMSDKLAAAKTLSFVAQGSFDLPARTGQPLFYLTRSDVLLQRPDKLRVIVPGDGPPSEFYYDGSKVSVFQPGADLVATANMSGNLDSMLEAIYERAGIYFPFVDFISTDPYKTLTTGLTHAFVIGKSQLVDNTTTDVVAISTRDVSLQIWIGSDDKLPRLVWATMTSESGMPRHMVQFSDWKLDGAAPGQNAFQPKTGDKTKQIGLARPDVQASAKPKP